MIEYYSCWAGTKNQSNKQEMHNWCEQMFGPGNVDVDGWSLTSHYDKRPIPNDRSPCPSPYMFMSSDSGKVTMFTFRWS